MTARKAVLGLALLLSWSGCNLVLGIEPAETIGQGGGIVAQCNDDGDCDDNNPCTEDVCGGGLCTNEAVPDGPAPDQLSGDCQQVNCTAGVEEVVVDDADVPVDGQECTNDVCTDGAPSNPNVAGGTACSQDGGQVCNGQGACTECFDNTHCTSPETCGGGGAMFVCGCTASVTCSSLDLSCGSGGIDDCGAQLNCNNMLQDEEETDVDCGGPVTTQGGTCDIRCGAGKKCVINSDCASNDCDTGTMTCN